VLKDQINRTENYTIYTIEWDKITVVENYSVTSDYLKIADTAFFLSQKGVKVLLAGNIGIDEIELFGYFGIKVFWNYQGNVRTIIKKYLESELFDFELAEQGYSKTQIN
jgi:predicted Fe-Mo cluster-binding NifX family protein